MNRPAGPDAPRRRRWLVAGAVAAVPAGLAAGFGHAGQHMARSVLLPGAGLYDERPAAGVALTLLGVVAAVAWVRWGVDWAVVAVIVVAVAVTGILADGSHAATGPLPQHAAHEFPLVLLVLAAIGWARALFRRLPWVGRLRLRSRRQPGGIHDLARLAPVDRCRAAAVAALAGGWDAPTEGAIASALQAPDVTTRARRIGLVARGRLGGDPLRGEHAHARAALALWGRLNPEQRRRLRADTAAAWAGVPASEPGWVRPLDGTLAALALAADDPSVARRWRRTLDGSLRLRRGHRPAAVWAPLGVAAGRADAWEHAAATALARAAGWLGDGDWAALRRRALGAAARGSAVPADERLIAAARVWVALVDDEPAARLLARPTVRRDPLAVALDALASRLRHDPHALGGHARTTTGGMTTA